MAEKYPWPWTVHLTGPYEWCVKSGDDVLFYLSAAQEDIREETGDPDARAYGDGNYTDVFSAETIDNGITFGPLFDDIEDDNDAPFLRQLERLLKGPKA